MKNFDEKEERLALEVKTLPGGGFFGGEQTRTLPGGGFHFRTRRGTSCPVKKR